MAGVCEMLLENHAVLAERQKYDNDP